LFTAIDWSLCKFILLDRLALEFPKQCPLAAGFVDIYWVLRSVPRQRSASAISHCRATPLR